MTTQRNLADEGIRVIVTEPTFRNLDELFFRDDPALGISEMPRWRRKRPKQGRWPKRMRRLRHRQIRERELYWDPFFNCWMGMTTGQITGTIGGKPRTNPLLEK